MVKKRIYNQFQCIFFISVSVYDQSKGGEIGSWFSGCYKNAEDACYLKDTSKYFLFFKEYNMEISA